MSVPYDWTARAQTPSARKSGMTREVIDHLGALIDRAPEPIVVEKP
jgi:hypothetical protein